MWKLESLGDRFARKFLNLKLMIISHDFCIPVIQVKDLSREDR
jgi:hypothetical protein